MAKSIKPIVYLQGGLGNQLFQYAYYLNHKVENKDAEIDVGRLIHDGQHNNISVIDFLKVDKDSYMASDNKSLPCLIKGSIVAKSIRYILRMMNIRNIPSSFYDYDAMSRFENIGKDKFFYIGYFQFIDSALFAKSYFESKLTELYGKQLYSYSKKYGGMSGLHVRRGDFVLSKNSKHACVSLDYVKKAINSTMEDIVVFSDDINWCKENLSEFPFLEFHCGNNAFDDFLALSQCSNYILSGSTFSWWAAFIFSSSSTEILFPYNQKAQFLSKRSNDKIGWKYSGL